MHFSDLINSLVCLIETKRAVTGFINGAPGSGKTALLQRLATELPKQIRQSHVFGPYSTGSIQSLTNELANDFYHSAFLEGDLPSDKSLDLIGSFGWFKQNLQTNRRQLFIILLDLDYASLEEDDWRRWFSSIRSLEDRWEDGPARLLFIVASCWNHNLLEQYYRKVRLSFPYTLGQNYFLWNGVSKEQVSEIINRYFPDVRPVVPLGSLLHEITGGHPGAAIDILDRVPPNQPLSIPALIAAAKKAACHGDVAKVLVKEWSRLPPKALAVVRHLLLMRQIPVISLQLYFAGLCSVGLLREEVVAGTGYGVLNCWYIECAARFHLKELGIEDEELNCVNLEELSPPLTTINHNAYQIISEIEYLARNFAIVRMSDHQSPDDPILLNRAIRHARERDEYICAHERASEWKSRSRHAGLMVDLNPLIAFLSIRDLALLINELASELNLEQWKNIADALEAVSDIRDAVMHNQLIDDAAYIRLFDLRSAIYKALQPESTPTA